MSPFREPPPVRLGPLDVGLESAALRARGRVPTGGRLLLGRGHRAASHLGGAAGSLGLLAVSIVAASAWTSKWAPHGAADVGLCALLVIVGGTSLARVLWAVERRSAQLVEKGEVVGGRARRVMDRLASLGRRAQRGAALGRCGIGALRRALRKTNDPAISAWIPNDVRGRSELLLARALATHGGDRWSRNGELVREVGELLDRAALHLDEPDPAEADRLRLAELGAARLEAEGADDTEEVGASAPGLLVARSR